MLFVDGSGKAVLLGHLTLPFSKNGVALLPIVLFGGGELFGMVGLGLAGTERLRDGEHTASLFLEVERRLEFLFAIDLGGIQGAIRVSARLGNLLFCRLVRLRFGCLFILWRNECRSFWHLGLKVNQIGRAHV